MSFSKLFKSLIILWIISSNVNIFWEVKVTFELSSSSESSNYQHKSLLIIKYQNSNDIVQNLTLKFPISWINTKIENKKHTTTADWDALLLVGFFLLFETLMLDKTLSNSKQASNKDRFKNPFRIEPAI